MITVTVTKTVQIKDSEFKVGNKVRLSVSQMPFQHPYASDIITTIKAIDHIKNQLYFRSRDDTWGKWVDMEYCTPIET